MIESLLARLKQQGVHLYLVDGKLKYQGKKGALTEDIRQEIALKKLDIVNYLCAQKDSDSDQGMVFPFKSENVSFAQQRLWFIDGLEGGGSQYHMPAGYQIIGNLNIEYLRHSIEGVISRHQVLGSNLVLHEGRLDAINSEERKIDFQFFNLTNVNVDEQIKTISEISQAELGRPFSLEKDPLLRCCLIKLSDNEHTLLFNMHHVVADGWSITILMRELAAFYNAYQEGVSVALAELPIQYVDFARWQNKLVTSGHFSKELSYWQKNLSGMPVLHTLPLDHNRPKNQMFVGGNYSAYIDSVDKNNILNICHKSNATLFMFFQTVFSILISKLSGESDIVMGVPIAGRVHKDTEHLIGLFVNTLVLRTSLSQTADFATTLSSNRAIILDAFSHQNIPFEILVKTLQPERNLAYNPLVQILITLNNTAKYTPSLKGLEVKHVSRGETVSKFDLELDIKDFDGGLSFHWNYSNSLFNHETIIRWSDSFISILHEVLTNPLLKISEISALPETAHKQILMNSAGPVVAHGDTTIYQLFEQHAISTPEASALCYQSISLSYQELNERSNRLAHYLMECGVGPDTIVSVCMERSIDMVVALLGILKAGGAYLPLNPDYPSSRLNGLLEDSGSPVVLTHSGVSGQSFAPLLRVLDLDDSSLRAILDHYPSTNPGRTDVTGHHLAYVIYTSGSTGQPKGVCIEHGALVNRIVWMKDAYGIVAADRFLQKTPFSFDVSVWEFFLPLVSGAQLVMAEPGGHKDPDYLASTIESFGITQIHFVPSMLAMLLRTVDLSRCTSLKVVYCSGEALGYDLVDAFYRSGSQAGLHNLYGPTEAAIDVSYWDCSAYGALGRVAIGKPIDNIQLYNLDDNKNLVPVGVEGELYIGGVGLARCYLNKPDLTDASFISNPFADGGSSRLYRTGDIVRWLPEGELEYIGRRDEQVKVRGNRIEPGEIEHQLIRQPQVEQAIVVASGEAGDDPLLVAYITLRKAQVSWPLDEVTRRGLIDKFRQGLQSSLPAYMLPGLYVFMESLPLSVNGKVDKKALPRPGVNDRVQTGYVPPRNARETTLCEIWQEILGLEQVGIYDNFFSLGGDSIVSIQCVARARQRGLYFTVRQLFENQTVEALSSHIATENAVSAPQGASTGVAELLPIQAAFFERALPVANHYNQSVLLDTPAGFGIADMQAIVGQLYQRHDGLRLRFHRVSDQLQWQGTYQAFTPDMLDDSVVYHDLRNLPCSDHAREIERKSNNIQASLDIVNGPLFKAVFFGMGEQQGRLLLVIHHLVVDGVSWRILLSDIEHCWQQRFNLAGSALVLPPKTSSLQQWGDALRLLSQSESLLVERAFWVEQSEAPLAALPRTAPPAGSSSRLASNEISLSPEETRQLLGDCNKNYRTQVNELLLAALLSAYQRWSGNHSLRVEMEGHGREALFPQLDISETLGWFTSIYPLVLSSDPGQGIGHTIKAVKEAYRRVPNGGVGYGLLRYVCRDPALCALDGQQTQNAIEFNYLGQFDNALGNGSPFSLGNESTGHAVSPANPTAISLSVTGMVRNSSLTFSVKADPSLHHIEGLCHQFRKSLQDIIAHCDGRFESFTPSDFPLSRLGGAELDIVQQRYPALSNLYVATPMQAGMLFHGVLDGSGSSYTTQIYFDIEGCLHRAAFEQAWQEVIARHEILRTCFIELKGSDLHQVIQDGVTLNLVVEDWSHLDAVAQSEHIRRYRQHDKARGFEFEQAPLMRITLIKRADEHYHFIWSCHHVLLDGWSMPIVFGEVMSVYDSVSNGREVSLLPAEPYENYLAWLGRQDVEKAKAYWAGQLAGVNAPTRLPLCSGRKAVEGGEAGVLGECLSAELSESLRALAKHTHSTMNVILQAAWSYLLYRYSGERDVVFGTTVSGRPAELSGVEGMVGLFINTVPVRVRYEDDLTLEGLLGKLHAENIEREEYGYLPLTEIHGVSEIPGGVGLFDSLVVFENYPVRDSYQNREGNAEHHFKIKNPHSQYETNYTISLVAHYKSDLLNYEIQYLTALIDADAATNISEHYKKILESIVSTNLAIPASSIKLLTDEEEKNISDWTKRNRVMDGGLCVHHLFEARAELQPASIALEYKNNAYTYGQLNSRANQLAHYLIDQGIKPDDVVGICINRNENWIVSVLAVLKSGAAYLPLDPLNPQERIEYILVNSQVKFVISEEVCVDRLPRNINAIFIDGFVSRYPAYVNKTFNPQSNAIGLTPNNLAYVIYTSGSTGLPKGVLVEHNNVMALLNQCESVFDFVESDVWTLFHSYAFDFSVWEMWGAFKAGARIVLVSDEVTRSSSELAELICNCGVTVLSQTPSVFYPMVEHLLAIKKDHQIRYIVFGGEELDCRRLANWFGASSSNKTKIINMYGITETTIHVTFREVISQDVFENNKNIGASLKHLSLYICDANMQLQPIGVEGEIYIAGDGVARGYMNNAKLTKEKFVDNVLLLDRKERLYKTGDVGRYTKDGLIEYLGRNDHQVQLRGYRIELDEVEHVLMDFFSIKNAKVLMLDAINGEKQIVAFLVCNQESGLNQAADSGKLLKSVKDHLHNKVPGYMVPASFIVIDSVPLSINGKVEREKLLEIYRTNNQNKMQYESGFNGDVEETMSVIWLDVLNLKDKALGPQSDFFELGGNSLLVVKLVSKIREKYRVSLKLKNIFERSTLRDVSTEVEKMISKQELEDKLKSASQVVVEEI